jgi:CRISPR-associated protein Csb2
MDLVGRQWARGDEGNLAEHRAMKSVRPQRLPEDAVVHYAWRLDDDTSSDAAHANSLIAAARGVVALGWGIDLVVGDGAVVDGTRLPELAMALNVWQPRGDGRRELRVPKTGTMEDLAKRHAAFVARTSLADPTLRPPPALTTFAISRYARDDQPRAVDIAGFTLMRVDADNFRAFDTPSRGMAVSGMLRHALCTAARRAGWDEARVATTVLGHGEGDEARLLLVPVPSIEPRGPASEVVGAVRRVMLFSTESGSSDAAWAARVLGGMELIDEKTGEVQAVLAATTEHDRVLSRYLAESTTWVTVTPMVLPGHDDPGGLRAKLSRAQSGGEQALLLERLMRRRGDLVRKALRHAGLSDDLALSASIETRETGFLAGVDRASRYAVPSHLTKWPRLHLKLTWPERVAGPLCIGRGRYSGLGLMVPVSE